jgi:hypothetical protein
VKTDEAWKPLGIDSSKPTTSGSCPGFENSSSTEKTFGQMQLRETRIRKGEFYSVENAGIPTWQRNPLECVSNLWYPPQFSDFLRVATGQVIQNGMLQRVTGTDAGRDSELFPFLHSST